MSEQQEPQSTVVMGHIADMKEKLATNTADTKNIFITLSKIEDNLKIHNALFVTHEQFKTLQDNDNDKETRIRTLESKVWKAIGALAILQIVILPVLFYLLFKIV